MACSSHDIRYARRISDGDYYLHGHRCLGRRFLAPAFQYLFSDDYRNDAATSTATATPTAAATSATERADLHAHRKSDECELERRFLDAVMDNHERSERHYRPWRRRSDPGFRRLPFGLSHYEHHLHADGHRLGRPAGDLHSSSYCAATATAERADLHAHRKSDERECGRPFSSLVDYDER